VGKVDQLPLCHNVTSGWISRLRMSVGQ
jgi:hypothetical protein